MILTLEVTGPEAARLGAGSRCVFSTQGGVIGRAKTSDLALSHAKVSSRHAVISYLDGVFYVEDTSTNGVCINSPGNRLVRGRRYALESGDRILIEPYEIHVSVSHAHDAPSQSELRGPHEAGLVDRPGGAPSAFGIDDPFAPEPSPRQTPRRTPVRDRSTPEPVPVEEVDPLKLLGVEAKRTPARKAPTAEDLDRRPLVEHHYQPPAVHPPPVAPPDVQPPPVPEPAASFLIPAGYDPLLDDFTEPEAPTPAAPPRAPTVRSEPAIETTPAAERPRATPQPAMPSAPPALVPEPSRREVAQPRDDAPADRTDAEDGAAGLTAVLAGAGLENIPPTPELARRIGEIFRVVVSGVMDVLRSRQQVKDEFRMRMTQFRPADNNPLKFSANVEDALHNLLVKRNPAYLEPVEAFEDAFDDLRNHQLAVLAGMRVAFESMLAQFEPDRLEKEFDRQLKRVPIFRAIARLRYWDLYRDRRDEMAKDPDASFKQLFGEEFARAYEEQLNRLKAESRARVAADRQASPVRR